MSQIIFLNTYAGLSDFTFDVTSSGRQLTLEQVVAQGLFTDDMQRRHKESSYVYQWYEVSSGDIFTIRHISDDVRHQTVLKVPHAGMRRPNTNIDNLDATATRLESHLISQCEMVSQESI